VLADGTLLRTGGKSRKDVAGYDLTRLLVGSEGTLALITEITLRLRRRPLAPTPDRSRLARAAPPAQARVRPARPAQPRQTDHRQRPPGAGLNR